MPLIEVNDIVKNFGDCKALDEVSFAVEEGETFGIVGESGSGKTTLGRIMLKLIQQSSGSIVYRDGFSRRDYQIVFQNPYTSLNPRMKVRSILEEPLKIHRVDRDAGKLLNDVELDASFLDKFPHELSGGERQRVGIARAISINPKFILLDEPVSSLDITVSSSILRLLKKLKAELKLTYVFIAHDLAVIRHMCDRVGVMKNGRLIESGRVGDVFYSPQHSYTKLLLESVPELPAFAK
jgi:peptide/nickel transport system ATP-binding protein